MVTDLVDWAAAAGGLLYLVVFLLVFGESAFLMDLFVPGEVGLVLAAAAVERADGNLPLVMALAASGAVLGDSTSYWIGRLAGPGAANRWRFTRKRLAPALERAHATFEHRGGFAVFGARWVGALRAVVPVVAGAAQMSYPRFLAWSAPAALAWAVVISSLGWFLGESVASTVDRLGLWISVVVVAALAAWFLWRRRARRRESGDQTIADRAGSADHPHTTDTSGS